LGEAGSTRSGLFAGCDEARVRLSSGAPAGRVDRAAFDAHEITPPMEKL